MPISNAPPASSQPAPGKVPFALAERLANGASGSRDDVDERLRDFVGRAVVEAYRGPSWIDSDGVLAGVNYPDRPAKVIVVNHAAPFVPFS